jgi:hypothetical protein
MEIKMKLIKIIKISIIIIWILILIIIIIIHNIKINKTHNTLFPTKKINMGISKTKDNNFNKWMAIKNSLIALPKFRNKTLNNINFQKINNNSHSKIVNPIFSLINKTYKILLTLIKIKLIIVLILKIQISIINKINNPMKKIIILKTNNHLILKKITAMLKTPTLIPLLIKIWKILFLNLEKVTKYIHSKSMKIPIMIINSCFHRLKIPYLPLKKPALLKAVILNRWTTIRILIKKLLKVKIKKKLYKKKKIIYSFNLKD